MVRLGGEPESGHFEDRTGQRGYSLGRGGGGGMLFALLHLAFSRFGIVGVAILLLGYCAVTTLGGGGGIIGGGGTQQVAPAGQSRLQPEMRAFLTRLLGSTEDTWGEIFAGGGTRYQPTRLVAYAGGTDTACGAGQAVMGPFYCPSDRSIYIDPTFFNELSRRFGAPGDFAMAYVIAHEVGHHIQNLDGTLDRAQALQARSSRADGNRIQVSVELQADCYAGVWAARARDDRGSILEPGDVEEGMRAAEAIGDDLLQMQAQGRVVPESFTHGTSAQRQAALRRGLESADRAACNL